MKYPKVEVGSTYGRLTVVNLHHHENFRDYWSCQCVCGKVKVIQGGALKDGTTKSCGCLAKELRKAGYQAKCANLRSLPGEKFNYLTILEEVPSKNKDGRPYYLCLCDCGNTREVSQNNLRTGQVKSCGCYKLKTPSNLRHGKSSHPLYDVYLAIKQRCFNPQNKAYKDYGGRGIVMEEPWLSSFDSFYTWCLNHKYKKGLQLDRRDNNGPYAPWNCRFVTRRENMRNTRRAFIVEYGGIKQSLYDLYKKVKPPLKYLTVYNRITVLGWDIEKALTEGSKQKMSTQNWKNCEKGLKKLYESWGMPCIWEGQVGRQQSKSTYDVKLLPPYNIPELCNDAKYSKKTWRHHTLLQEIKDKYCKKKNDIPVLYTKVVGKPYGCFTMEAKYFMGLLAYFFGIFTKEEVLERWGISEVEFIQNNTTKSLVNDSTAGEI